MYSVFDSLIQRIDERLNQETTAIITELLKTILTLPY